MPQTDKQLKGAWGENKATKFLMGQGYEIVEKNFRIEKIGEIDIIAWHTKRHFGKTLCFIEVKTRGSFDGSAERSVDYAKLQKLFRAARVYCMREHINSEKTPIQFEQISIYTQDGEPEVRHYVIPVD